MPPSTMPMGKKAWNQLSRVVFWSGRARGERIPRHLDHAVADCQRSRAGHEHPERRRIANARSGGNHEGDADEVTCERHPRTVLEPEGLEQWSHNEQRDGHPPQCRPGDEPNLVIR